MIPRLTIQTGSQDITWPISVSPQPPNIALGNAVTPASPPDGPTGWQIAVVQYGNVSDPDAIVLNNYYTVSTAQEWWSDAYGQMYDAIVNDVSAVNQQDNLLIAATFGLDNNMPPTNAMTSLLQSAGAGSTLQSWFDNCDPGSEVGNPSAWVSYPAAYALVGTFGYGADSAAEVYQGMASPSSLNLAVFFYFQ